MVRYKQDVWIAFYCVKRRRTHKLKKKRTVDVSPDLEACFGSVLGPFSFQSLIKMSLIKAAIEYA